MSYIRVKNWDEYQHYKDRSAPWIKLHKELLSSHFWVMGSDAGKLLAICIMLLAQRNDNKIPADPEYIKRFGHLETYPDFAPLIESQLIEIVNDNECTQNASTTLATCSPEENRGEENKNLCAPVGDAAEKPIYSKSFEAFWNLYPHKKSKGNAYKAFKKIKSVEYPAIKSGLLLAIESTAWAKNSGEFIPHPASWLNARGWEDDHGTASTANPFEGAL